jgi:hypothetical protein
MSRAACSNRLSAPTDRGSTGHSPARDIVDFRMSEQKAGQHAKAGRGHWDRAAQNEPSSIGAWATTHHNTPASATTNSAASQVRDE